MGSGRVSMRRGGGLAGAAQGRRLDSTAELVRQILREAHEPMTVRELHRVAVARGATADYGHFRARVQSAAQEGRLERFPSESRYGLPRARH